MRLTARSLASRWRPGCQHPGVAGAQHAVRNVAECGHCQLGPLLLCRDGPVVSYTVAEPLMAIREL